MTQQTIPRDWPNRVRLAVRAAKDAAERRQVAADVVDLLHRGDPMDLRQQGLCAVRRREIYDAQVMAQLRRAA